MKVVEAICEIMKREGIEMLLAYPVNHIIEYAARVDIRPIIVRQERIGLHMADAISRLSSGKSIGSFAMQHGPGTENAYGGIAQAYGESVPILVLPAGYARRLAHIHPNYNATQSMRDISKSVEPVMAADELCNIMRRAFTRLKNGRGAPVIVEVPGDTMFEEIEGELDYTPVLRTRSGPDPADVARAAAALIAAKRPLLYAGQGVHYAEAWDELKELAELLVIPVSTSLQGKSAFDETHPLSVGAGGRAFSKQIHHFLHNADLVLGIGCSFTETSFGIKFPPKQRYIHATLDHMDLNKDIECEIGMVGDAQLTLQMLIAEVRKTVTSNRDATDVMAEIKVLDDEWMADWLPKLTSEETPLNPYRVLWELQKNVEKDNTIITHDAGSPRDQLSPFWKSTTPLSYIGWGKTTQLGYGLGLAMGAKLYKPDALCINVWGDAAIGFTGMDFETCVRERIPIMSILLNNFSMAIELHIMQESTAKYRSTDISGDYAAMARAFGGYGERVTDPAEIGPAIRRGIEQTQNGVPVLLEFITSKETNISIF
jgi:acetolactate synthase-1/2/3 large subunit